MNVMFVMWAAGIGPDELYFGPGSDQVHDMEDAPGVEKARRELYQRAGGGPLQDYTNVKDAFGAEGYLAAGLSPTQQFVGSYRIDINVVASEDADYLQFTLTNPQAGNRLPINGEVSMNGVNFVLAET